MGPVLGRLVRYLGRVSGGEQRVEGLCEEIAKELRRAAGGGYDEEHNGLADASWAVLRLCRGLTVKEARAARPTFLAVLEMREVAGCVPECCNASYVRMMILRAKFEVLRAWTGRDPAVAAEIPRKRVEKLLAPYSRRIAVATAELFALSPEGTRVHLDVLLDALEEHPRWQVRWGLVRALGRAPLEGRTPSRVLEALERAAGEENDEVRRAGVRAWESQERRQERALRVRVGEG